MKDLSREPMARLGEAVIGVGGIGLLTVACGGASSGEAANGGADPPAGDPGGGWQSPFAESNANFDRPGSVAWQPLELSFDTGALSPVHGGLPHEEDPTPGNPWLDWRFDLELTRPDGREVRLPGFFAGDGNGGSRGDVWRVRFTPPDLPGLWRGIARLRHGEAVNVDEPHAARGDAVFEQTVDIRVLPPAPGSSSGLWRRGPITADGHGRLRHADGKLYVKAGVGSPENFLGYAGFDGAADGQEGGPPGEHGGAPDFLHTFAPHVADWRFGDPDWSNGAGRGIVGALNYLGSMGANSLYVLPMNLGGDGRDTFPFASNGGGPPLPPPGDLTVHYAVRRLQQWNTVLEHAQSRGVFVQFVLAEREPTNIAWLGAGDSPERRLFQKMLVALFGHLPGVEWTMCEENAAPGSSGFVQFTLVELENMASWIRAWDTQAHPRSVHVDPNDLSLFQAMVSSGRDGWLECVSLQVHGDGVETGGRYGALAEEAARLFRQAAGRDVVVHVDEPGHYLTGVGSQLHPEAWANTPWASADDRRRRILYDVLLSGGGLAWYFGLYDEAEGGGDLTTEDFRTRAEILRQTRIARSLVENVFDGLQTMRPADERWSSDAAQSALHSVYGEAEVLWNDGGPAVVYLPTLGENGVLTLGELEALDPTGAPGSRTDAFEALWFDPRLGTVVGSARHFDPTLPFRPSAPAAAGSLDRDWVMILRSR